MSTYPDSFELEIRLKVKHLYELCQFCFPVLEGIYLPSIKKWEIPLFSPPQSKGLEKKLEELRQKLERGDTDTPNSSKFILGESGHFILYLSYYENDHPDMAGSCCLVMYVKEHHTYKDAQLFVNHAIEFAERLAARAPVKHVILYRGSGNSYIPDAPLVSSEAHMISATPELVRANYDDPEIFWDSDYETMGKWHTVEKHGDIYLLTRSLGMDWYLKNSGFNKSILPHQWKLIRAAKPGLVKYFYPRFDSEEREIFYAGEQRLYYVAYLEEKKLVEYSCYLGAKDEHVQGWEIFELWNVLDDGHFKDGRKVETIRVMFGERWMAEQEKRPLLDIGVKVMCADDAGKEVEITE